MCPVYEYECINCGRVIEQVFPVSSFPKQITCKCGSMAHKIISHGAVLTDGDVPWLESAKKTLPNDAKPIETRSGLKKYLKNNNLACVG